MKRTLESSWWTLRNEMIVKNSVIKVVGRFSMKGEDNFVYFTLSKRDLYVTPTYFHIG